MRLDGPLLGQTTKVPALRCARHGVEKRCGVVRAPGRERAALGELVAGRDLVTRGGWSDAGWWSCHAQDWNQNIGCASASFLARLTAAGVYMRFALSSP